MSNDDLHLHCPTSPGVLNLEPPPSQRETKQPKQIERDDLPDNKEELLLYSLACQLKAVNFPPLDHPNLQPHAVVAGGPFSPPTDEDSQTFATASALEEESESADDDDASNGPTEEQAYWTEAMPVYSDPLDQQNEQLHLPFIAPSLRWAPEVKSDIEGEYSKIVRGVAEIGVRTATEYSRCVIFEGDPPPPGVTSIATIYLERREPVPQPEGSEEEEDVNVLPFVEEVVAKTTLHLCAPSTAWGMVAPKYPASVLRRHGAASYEGGDASQTNAEIQSYLDEVMRLKNDKLLYPPGSPPYTVHLVNQSLFMTVLDNRQGLLASEVFFISKHASPDMQQVHHDHLCSLLGVSRIDPNDLVVVPLLLMEQEADLGHMVALYFFPWGNEGNTMMVHDPGNPEEVYTPLHHFLSSELQLHQIKVQLLQVKRGELLCLDDPPGLVNLCAVKAINAIFRFLFFRITDKPVWYFPPKMATVGLSQAEFGELVVEPYLELADLVLAQTITSAQFHALASAHSAELVSRSDGLHREQERDAALGRFSSRLTEALGDPLVATPPLPPPQRFALPPSPTSKGVVRKLCSVCSYRVASTLRRVHHANHTKEDVERAIEAELRLRKQKRLIKDVPDAAPGGATQLCGCGLAIPHALFPSHQRCCSGAVGTHRLSLEHLVAKEVQVLVMATDVETETVVPRSSQRFSLGLVGCRDSLASPRLPLVDDVPRTVPTKALEGPLPRASSTAMVTRTAKRLSWEPRPRTIPHSVMLVPKLPPPEEPVLLTKEQQKERKRVNNLKTEIIEKEVRKRRKVLDLEAEEHTALMASEHRKRKRRIYWDAAAACAAKAQNEPQK